MNKTDFIFGSLITICISIIIIYLIIGCIIQNKDVLVKEDSEYLYYKEFTLYNRDSAVYKYHKPIYYDGVITNIYRSQHIVGLLSKGGHWNSDFDITISYDSKTYAWRKEMFGLQYHCGYNKGDKVKVVETFYPHYKIEYIY